MVEIRNLFLQYTREFYALHDVSLKVVKGDFVALIGSEDSGKTSLLRVLAKLEKYTKGEVYVKEIALNKLDLKDDISMAYVPAMPVFLENKTVHENFEYVLNQRRIDAKDSRKLIDSALINFNLEKIKDTKVNELTLYEKYYVSLVRLTLRELELVLIDNIFDELTEEEINQITKLIKEQFVKNHITTIIATTKEDLATKLGAKKVYFSNGSVVKR